MKLAGHKLFQSSLDWVQLYFLKVVASRGFPPAKRTLLWLAIKLMLTEKLIQDLLLSVIHLVFPSSAKDQNVIKEYDKKLLQIWLKNCIHEGHKCCRSIVETTANDLKLKMSKGCIMGFLSVHFSSEFDDIQSEHLTS